MKTLTPIWISCLFFFYLEPLIAQQLPLFTQYREMHGIINPAAVGRDVFQAKNTIIGGVSYRRQWIDAPQAPSTIMANVQWLKEMGGSYLLSGLYIVDDRLGKENTLGIYQRAGVLISNDIENYGIAVGFNGGMVNYRVRLSETTARDPDPLISGDRHKWRPDFGAGVFGYTKLGNDHLIYGGFSIPQIFGLKGIQLTENLDVVRYRHYYLTGGYIIPFNNEGSDLEISTWTKFVPHTRPNVDLNLRFNINNIFQLGAGFNTNKSLSLEATYLLGYNTQSEYEITGMWRFGYSYNMNFSPISSYMGNSHEFHFSVAFGGGNNY